MDWGNGIYITATRPYEGLANFFSARGTDLNRLFFIDCISQHLGISDPSIPSNVRYVQTPTMLEFVSLYADDALRTRDPSFVILDSLSSLLIYNSEDAVRKFLHALANKMRQKGIKIYIISMEDKHPASFFVFCDEIVDG
ncbi:MAG: hypothetical protein CVT48_04545 [Thermoplasmata archaeon HGW-Thermoplasmata-1]|nr:MAG: hypothetical protein CVT48_04545 [Thermoplasmata archaeon HGW-Thermoplasmata-1]